MRDVVIGVGVALLEFGFAIGVCWVWGRLERREGGK